MYREGESDCIWERRERWGQRYRLGPVGASWKMVFKFPGAI